LVGLAGILCSGSGMKGFAVGSSCEGWTCWLPMVAAVGSDDGDDGSVGSLVVVAIRALLGLASCWTSFVLQLGFGSVVGGVE
jgi:hypothetical protein